MNTAKENFIILLKSFFLWLVVFGMSYVTATLQLIGKKKTGWDGSGFLPSTVYEVNMTMYLIGSVLFIILFFVLWHFFIFNNLEKLKEEHTGYKIFFFVLCAIGIFGIFVGMLLALIMENGLFSSLRPEWTEIGMLIFPALALIILVADVLVHRDKITKKLTDEE